MFSIANIIAAGAWLLEQGAGVAKMAGASDEVASGIGYVAHVGPTAIQILEDLTAGTITSEIARQRYLEGRDMAAAGNAAWVAAPGPTA